jgi:hypothetical protein
MLEGKTPEDVTEQEVAQVAADLENFMRAYGVKRDAVAKAISYAPSVISEFTNGNYRGNNGRLAKDIDAWLADEEERRAQPSTTQFVWTNAAMKIKGAAGYCLTKAKMGMVYAPDSAGIGKTTALRAIQEELGPRRCTFVTVDKVDCNAGGLLTRICEALGTDLNGSNRMKQERIIAKILGKRKGQDAKPQVQRSHLLIIDQIHNLRFAKGDVPIYILADIFERTRTGQLWSGTARMYEYLFKQQLSSSDESLAQIRSRIWPTIDLMDGLREGDGGGSYMAVTIEQMREIFAKNTLKLTDRAARFLCRLANLPDSGCLRLVTNLVEYATYMCEQQGLKSIDEPQIREAMAVGLVPSEAETLISRVPAPAAAQRKTATA